MAHDDVADRFWSKVRKTDGCWFWTGSVFGSLGYGYFTVNGHPVHRSNYAHRVAWELTHGRPIPYGQSCLHACDEPRCVRPEHLFLGTQKDNMRDAQRKGRLHVQRPARQKVSDADVATIKKLAASGMMQVAIAHQFGVSKAFVSLILKGKRRQHKKPRRAA